MRISQLLQSDLVSDYAIIEIWRKPFGASKGERAGKWERVAEGYKNEYSVLKFEGMEISEFSYKSYPETFSIFI